MRIVLGVMIAFICLAGIATQSQAATEPQDQQAWDKAQKENSEAGFALYISRYPSGSYLAEANAKLKLINEEAAKRPALIPAMIAIPGKDYEIGKYEVSQADWRLVMGNSPSKFGTCGDNCPVEKVSWDDAQIFIQKLNAKTGKQYRLPTAAEWEFACQGGTQTEYCGGNSLDAVAWTEGNSKQQTHPVGQLQANGYGLYDMSGNVMEWTDECWEGNCAQRVFRGGSWANAARDARVSNRIRFGTVIRNGSGGFRLARTLP